MNRSNFGVVLVNKKRRPLRINDLRFCCVQDEDIILFLGDLTILEQFI